MENNKNAIVEHEAPIKNKAKTTANTYTYDPDDYMKEFYGDMSYYDENCFSCRRWLGYGCGAAGPCDYEAF